MFSTLSVTNPIISATPNLSSALALNLDIPKIVSFGQELILLVKVLVVQQRVNTGMYGEGFKISPRKLILLN